MKHKIKQTTLSEARDGQTGIIVSVLGGNMSAKRLADMGLIQGTAVKIIRRTLFSGPVQIEVCGSRLVLGKGLASKIFIELK
jgi:ferrous iron transport protein A